MAERDADDLGMVHDCVRPDPSNCERRTDNSGQPPLHTIWFSSVGKWDEE